jgi:RNA polymerase sigma-70 factor (ECF subfamily)
MQDSHLAEDVVQDTFIKIWEQKRELILSPEVRYYLITAVKNNCISALRKQNTRNEVFTDIAPETEPEPFVTATQHKEQQNDEKRRINQALQQLPPKCKEVFLLVKLYGMTYKQAAATLEISVKTVENQMGKAIKTLKDFAGKHATFIWTILLIKKFILAIGVITML